MTGISKILKHNVIGKLLNHVIVFLINVMLVRYLGAAESGIYFNELYVLNFVVFLFSAGLDYAAIIQIAQEPALLPAIHKMLFKAVLLFAFFLIIIVLLILPFTNKYFTQPAFAIISFSIGNLMLLFYQAILSAQKKFNLQNLILLTTNLLFLAYLFLGINFFHAEIKQLIVAYASLFLFQGILMWLSGSGRKLQQSITVSWPVFVRPGMIIMTSSIIYFVFLRIDNFFVEKYTSPLILGNYVQCGKIGQYFLYFSSAVSSTLLPFISSEKIGSSFIEWKRVVTPYILLLIAAAAVIAFGGKLIFPFLFGKDFGNMYHLMLILLPGFVCLGGLTLMNAIYIGKGNLKKMLKGDILGLVLVTGFDSVLVPQYGAEAAAIISSVSYCIVFLYLLSGFKKQFLLSQKVSSVIKIL